MTITVLLIVAIFVISLVLTMVGLGGGLIFSPLYPWRSPGKPWWST